MNPLNIVLIVFILVLLYFLLSYIFSDPYTLQSIQNGKTSTTIASSSLATTGSPADDTNMAYSIWFYINDWNYRYGDVKTIFTRTDSKNKHTYPAVELGAIENNLMVTLACFPGTTKTPTTSGTPTTSETPTATSVDHTCTVGNIPIQRWVNLIVSVYGRSMDIYIDGKLVKTCLLPGVANIDSEANVYVTPDGGFDGWTSKFQYFPSPLNPQEAWNIYSSGFSSSSTAVLGSYQVQLSLLENGNAKSTVTI